MSTTEWWACPESMTEIYPIHDISITATWCQMSYLATLHLFINSIDNRMTRLLIVPGGFCHDFDHYCSRTNARHTCSSSDESMLEILYKVNKAHWLPGHLVGTTWPSHAPTSHSRPRTRKVRNRFLTSNLPSQEKKEERKEKKAEKAREPRQAVLPDHETRSRFPALDSALSRGGFAHLSLIRYQCWMKEICVFEKSSKDFDSFW